jgi:hypothetical protein
MSSQREHSMVKVFHAIMCNGKLKASSPLKVLSNLTTHLILDKGMFVEVPTLRRRFYTDDR